MTWQAKRPDLKVAKASASSDIAQLGDLNFGSLRVISYGLPLKILRKPTNIGILSQLGNAKSISGYAGPSPRKCGFGVFVEI